MGKGKSRGEGRWFYARVRPSRYFQPFPRGELVASCEEYLFTEPELMGWGRAAKLTFGGQCKPAIPNCTRTGERVVVSFGSHTAFGLLSFPRRRKSHYPRPPQSGSRNWIPACAGMTGYGVRLSCKRHHYLLRVQIDETHRPPAS